MLDISPWQTWSTKRTILVNDSIISNSRIPIKTSPYSTQKSQSRDKRPSKYAHLQVNLAPFENIYSLSFEFTLQSSSSTSPSPCNISLSKPLLRKYRFRASIEGFLSSVMGYLLFVVLTLLVTWGRSFQPLRAPQPRFPYVCLCNPCQSLSANQLSPSKVASNI